MGILNPGSYGINPPTSTEFFDDFSCVLTNAGPTLLQSEHTWAAVVQNGTIVQTAPVANAPGLIVLTAGGVANNDRAVLSQNTGASPPILATVASAVVIFNLRNGQAGAANCEIRGGLQTGNGGGEPQSGMYFRLVGAGNWACVTRNGGVETQTPTVQSGANVAAHQYKIIFDGAGTTVVFLIDGVIVATHTTNIPAAGQQLGLNFNIFLPAIVGPYNFVLDYAYFKQINLNR